MKKAFLLVLMSLMGMMGAHAQFGDYGVKVGIGTATIQDDLITKSPVFGLNVGGYIDYTFAKSQSVLAEIFYLQTGLNLIHRGSNFEEIHEYANDLMIRTGSFHAWYAQIPILAGVHMELPIRKAGHVVGFYLGPAISVGLFGNYADRKVTPYSANYDANYDVDVNGTPADRAVFNHINRFDLGAIIGLSYEYRDFTVSLFLDHGFLATSEGEDVLRIIDNNMSGNNNKKINVKIPNGNNNAVMLSVAYRLGTISK
ncbi:MAG: PorT family protein [Bacteroidales bacterium]|nr:PorT family protein [Bacteroidales bacterium]